MGSPGNCAWMFAAVSKDDHYTWFFWEELWDGFGGVPAGKCKSFKTDDYILFEFQATGVLPKEPAAMSKGITYL